MKAKPYTLVLHNSWALGDTVCMSALVRDIHLAYPGEYEVMATGHYQNVYWLNNPHVVPAVAEPKGHLVKLDYHDGIVAAGRGEKVHFLSWFHRSLEKKAGIKVPVTAPKGEIFLSPAEAKPAVPGRYWVVVAGGKMDMTAKVWSAAYWQETVDRLKGHGITCVQAGGDFNRHFHPTLQNVVQMVGKTRSERDFFSLIKNADGVICGITAAMHIAAVFDKPCVVIAGGREEPWWEAYSNAYFPTAFGPVCSPVKVEHRFLHTVGALDCGIGNMTKGCWKDRAVPLEQADHVAPRNRAKLCVKPTVLGNQGLPTCLAAIPPDAVVDAVLSYGTHKGIRPLVLRGVDPASGPDVTKFMSIEKETGKIVFSQTLGPPPALGAGWAKDWDKQLPKSVKPRTAEAPEFAALDHPYVGGKFTLCVLGFGDHTVLMERCLNSIIDTCPPHRFDLRVALNQPVPKLLDYVNGLHNAGIVNKVYADFGDRKKYPAMRRMFWDDHAPIETKYVCWFDDDSWCRKKDWMVTLAQSIVANHPQQGRLYGAWLYHDLMQVKRPEAPREKWFQQANWWRNRPLYTGGGKRTAPNGSQIVFASGGFWALATDVIREADIPDVRLNHNGGDITIGCQVTQAGYKVVNFSPRPGKEIIAWSDSPRRGYHEGFPWA